VAVVGGGGGGGRGSGVGVPEGADEADGNGEPPLAPPHFNHWVWGTKSPII